ncbi:MAG: SdpI family protein [Sediminibacterium sp.]|jgi:uncharacterized membrane protein|nr:SdpI family protein [Chitinophagaceae bacterium]MCA6445831.1 SdpI family protein [Chitinophagaceae bacterium]
MQHKSPFQTWLVLILAIIPLAYLAYLYPSLPDKVPTHYNISGKIDAYDEKITIWIPVVIFSLMNIGIHFLFKALPKIDPKKSAAQSPSMLAKLSTFLAVFLALIQIAMIQATTGNTTILNKTLVPAIGLLFALIGNYMFSIKPNYFIGLRLPWTLENEDNWRKTHQYMSKYWVIGGIIIFITGLFTSFLVGIIVLFVVLTIIIILPVRYSYLLFKNQANNHS